MKICVASAVFKPEIQISPQTASAGGIFYYLIQYRTSICAVAGSPRGNWRRGRSWSVFTVAAEDVLDKSKSHWKFLIK